jgi:enamine deaminase RidA (YjgF/YER057c/UK114 family)
VSVEQAQEAARACALNVLAQIEAAAGLDQVEQITQLNGFVLSTDDFGDQPKVINAASDLLVEVLGDAGRHTRAALGTNALPFSVTVEVTAVAVVRTR